MLNFAIEDLLPETGLFALERWCCGEINVHP